MNASKSVNKFGILIDFLGPSYQNLLIVQNMNELMGQNQRLSPILFYQQYGIFPLLPLFAMMQVTNMWAFNAPVITTSLDMMEVLLNCPGPSRKILYMMDLEWLYHRAPYRAFENIYLNEEVEIIARSQEHSDIIESCWKKPSTIIEEFNHEAIHRFVS